MNKKLHFVFFGTSEFSTIVLDELETTGSIPSVVVCTPDKPAGRKMLMTPPPVKIWAEKRNIPVFQPQKLDADFCTQLHSLNSELFIIASYGKIIPQAVLDIPKRGTLNVHPSLLPKLRGASPIESAILSEDETGVTIMIVDAEMDHGAILAQEKTETREWPEYYSVLEKILAHQGGKMLAEVIPSWIDGTIQAITQDHARATFCKKISKEDALLNLDESPEKNLRKIRAFNVWPKAYFFLERKNVKMRIVVTEAVITDDTLVMTKIIPEGKKEMKYQDFVRNLR